MGGGGRPLMELIYEVTVKWTRISFHSIFLSNILSKISNVFTAPKLLNNETVKNLCGQMMYLLEYACTGICNIWPKYD